MLGDCIFSLACQCVLPTTTPPKVRHITSMTSHHITSHHITSHRTQLGGYFQQGDRLYHAITWARITRLENLDDQGYYVITHGAPVEHVPYPVPDHGNARIVR